MQIISYVSPSRARRALRRRLVLVAGTMLVVAPATARAQHEHHPPARADTVRADSMKKMMAGDTAMAMPGMAHTGHDMAAMMDGPLGISHARMGSGTSWMPDSSPMHATHKMWGDWTAMLHGVAFAQYDHQGSKRGDSQFGIVDWEMLMLMRRVGTGMLHLHGMASLEPATIGAKGYPLLLQTGESYKGEPLHDRQHPHDFVMELAALFQQPIASNLALELYGGLAGEPALGPVAFMHRPSAQNDPLSPLGHHWQDATHISYGVLTAGVYSRQWKLEGSWFNGREPHENRWNLDLRGLDSYSGRLTLNPTGRVSLSGWYGYLASPEMLHPDESTHRYGASVLYGGRGISRGAWESTLLWGANAHGGRVAHSALVESNLEIGLKNAVFARAEYVRKSAADLVLPNVDPEREFDVKSLVAGYVREVASIPGGTIGVGGRASVNFIPGALEPFYGTRHPAGFDVYVRVRPKRMAGQAMDMKGSMPVRQEGAPVASTPERTVEQFHAALAAGDSSTVVALLDTSAVVLESGEYETRSDYLRHHLPADIAYARAVPSVRHVRRVMQDGNMAWVASTSETTGSFNGRAVNSEGAELMVLTKGPSGWRIVAIHWSSRRRTP
jgi:ketosteroid isomerase-like protein